MVQRRLAIGTVAFFAVPAVAIATPPLQAGTYAVNGAFTSYSGEGCIILAKVPITSVFVYAGPGNTTYGSSLILESADAKSGVAVQTSPPFHHLQAPD